RCPVRAARSRERRPRPRDLAVAPARRRLLRALARARRELAYLALDPAQADGHDRHVDQHEREHHDVGAGHVLAGLVQGQRRKRGHQLPGHQGLHPPAATDGRGFGAALARCLTSARSRSVASPAATRLSARSCARTRLAVSSYLHRVAYRSATATSETANVSAIWGGRLEVLPSTRGCRYALDRRTAMKFSGTNAPPL